MYASLETLLINAANGEETSKEVDDLLSKFRGDVNVTVLVAQLSPFAILPRNLTAVKGLRPNEKHMIGNVIVVCKLIHVKPSTSATGETFFSTAKRIKTIKNAARRFQPSRGFEHTRREIREATFSFCGKFICFPERKS